MTDAICKTHYSNSELYTLMYSFEHSKNAFVCYLRGELCESVTAFFREISAAMRFPYYFGWNWNAFDECITDLEWLKFSSIIIVIEDYDLLFRKEDPKEDYKGYLITFLNSAIEYWTSQHVPISIYLNQR